TIERIVRFPLGAKNPHLWPAEAAAHEAAALPVFPADVVFCGADSSPERDRLELTLLARMGSPATPVCSIAGAVGSHASQGLPSVCAPGLALSQGKIPPVVGLERARPDFRFEFPKQAVVGSRARGLVLGVARGGAGMAIAIARAERRP